MKNKIEFLITERKEYFNKKRCDSYNAFINILIGGRGIGKTTNVLAPIIKNCVNKNIINKDKNEREEFIYLRRYKTETMKTKDLLNKYLKGCKIKRIGDGNGCIKYQVNDTIIGYSICLSCASAYKSVDFPYVKNIVYDEAILKPSGNYRYLKDEINALLEFASTIFRNRTNTKLYILGNNLDMFNPYFSYFKIPNFKEEYYDKERGIYICLCKNNKDFENIEKETPLYKLTKGTSYGDYHYNNVLLVSNNNYIIDKKPTESRILYRLRANNNTLNVYLCNELSLFIEVRDKIIDDNITYTIIDNNTINYYCVKLFRTLNYCKLLIKEYYNNDIIYENDKAYAITSNIVESLT